MTKRRVFGYARGSTTDQEQTLLVQQEAIEKEFHHRYEKEYEWGGCFVDRGVSGSKRLENRPEGLKLRAELDPGDLVIITKLDRGFRNARDFLEQMDWFFERNIRLRLLDLDLDTGTPMGRLMATLLAAIAEFERARLAERVREVNAHRRRQGLPCGQAPWGWRTCGRKAGKKRLIRDDELRTVAAQCLKWSEQGWSVVNITVHLWKLRIKRSKDGSEYAKSTVHNMIVNERLLQALEAQGIFYPITLQRWKEGTP